MKNIAFCITILFSSFVYSQNLYQLSEENRKVKFTPLKYNLQKNLKGLTNCSMDTIGYTMAKATSIKLISINNQTSAQAVSQYFDAPQPITVYGMTFYAYGTSIPTTNVTAELYLAGIDSMPTGSALASVNVSVDSSFGGGALSALEQKATFTSPVTMSQPYVLVVKNLSSNNIALAFNDYTVGDGANEYNCSVDLFGTWTAGYNVSVGGSPLNADALFEPYVTYDNKADFFMNPPCLTAPGLVTFINTSSSVVNHRMYNSAVFLGVNRLSYTYNFGDGTPTVNAIDTTHTFATAPPFTITLTDTIYGWTTTCTSTKTDTLDGALNSLWSQSSSNDTLNFTDLSTGGASSWFWDFGDGNTSTQQNPQHIYATSGNYSVCLTVTNNCGSDSTCQLVNVIITNLLSQNINEEFAVYPNPTKDVINIKVSEFSTIKLYDITGKVVFNANNNNIFKDQINIKHLKKGIYLLAIISNNYITTRKIIKE